MRHAARSTVLIILCLFGTPQGEAQQALCGGGDACIADDTAANRGHVEASAGPTPANVAGLEPCPGEPVNVAAASASERGLVCSAASEAVKRLGRCGISVRRPLNVHIMGEVRHPFGGPVLGLLDTKHEAVLVTREANIASLVEGTRYAKVPPRDFYRSVIVHEVVHGVMHQNLKRPATTHAAYEYPAYVLQIESLPQPARDAFLLSFDQAEITASSTLLSDVVLFFDPALFAARAYHHFNASGDGCARLSALMQGEVAFIAPPM